MYFVSNKYNLKVRNKFVLSFYLVVFLITFYNIVIIEKETGSIKVNSSSRLLKFGLGALLTENFQIYTQALVARTTPFF